MQVILLLNTPFNIYTHTYSRGMIYVVLQYYVHVFIVRFFNKFLNYSSIKKKEVKVKMQLEWTVLIIDKIVIYFIITLQHRNRNRSV